MAPELFLAKVADHLPCISPASPLHLPNYMAPELFLAKAYSTPNPNLNLSPNPQPPKPNPNPNPKLQAYSTPVDVFAFAVLLNELLSREVPWDGYQPMDIKAKVVAGERPRVPKTVPSACEGLLRKV